MAFSGRPPGPATAFEVFALTVLPTLYLLGVFTFVRVVECGAEDYRYGVAINRIRHYYKQLAGSEARLFLLSGHDDGRGVFDNATVPAEGRGAVVRGRQRGRGDQQRRSANADRHRHQR